MENLQALGDKIRAVEESVRELKEFYESLREGSPLLPPEHKRKRLLVWFEIYREGGIVDRDKFHRIGAKYGYDPRGLGGFFVGDDSSLEYAGVNRDKVVLRESAKREVEKYIEWLQKNAQS